MRLTRDDWRPLATAHAERAHRLVDQVMERRRRGQRHPVEDFLFDYYNLRPGQLLVWHPGIGIALEDADDYAGRTFYRVEHGIAQVDLDQFRAKRSSTIAQVAALLSAVAARPANFGCFGVHEWAMVYGLAPGETRHPYLPLRFGAEQIRRIVDDSGVRCSHFDAFRFFTEQARPLNSMQPTRETQIELDQPGCLHVNMDLYKWAGKLVPVVDSGLLLDTFELARDIRTLDMQASAYDLSDWGYQPVPVETAEGRRNYVHAQRGFATRAAALRARLIAVLDALDETLHAGPDQATADRKA